MKALLGVVPAVAILAVLATAGAGVGVPTALAEMQHRNITKFTPNDLPYGIMRAGEAIMGIYRMNKSEWNMELYRTREMERQELQKRCPNCTEQLRELEQEKTRIRQQEEERIREETQSRTGNTVVAGNEVQTRTESESRYNYEDQQGTPNQGTMNQGSGGRVR